MIQRVVSRAKGAFFNSTPDPYDETMPSPFTALPDDVLVEILLRLPAVDVVRGFRVSKQWHRVATTHRFWVQKCIADGYLAEPQFTAQFSQLPLRPLIQAICKRVFNRNLIEDDFSAAPPKQDKRWKNGQQNHFSYVGWKVQSPPEFLSEMRSPELDTNEVPFESCLVSSYQPVTRWISVNLKEHGLDPRLMNALKPTIVASEHFTNRADCGCRYQFNTWLKREKFNGRRSPPFHSLPQRENMREDRLIRETNEEIPQWEPQWWRTAEHVITDYPDDHHVVELWTRGSDTQFWAGDYGVKIAGTSLVVKFEFNRSER